MSTNIRCEFQSKKVCPSCKYYKDGYCENLEMILNYPDAGCDEFEDKETMYSIVLKDGKIINIKATSVEWCDKPRMAKLYDGELLVARINMDNVVGWIKADNIESEEV